MIVIVRPEEYQGKEQFDTEYGLILETIILCDNEEDFHTARLIAKTLELDIKKERIVGNTLMIPIYRSNGILH